MTCNGVRVELVVIREGDVRAMLRVKGDLEEVAKIPVRAAAEAAGADGPAVNDVVANDTLREDGYGAVAVDALRIVDVPIGPARHPGRALILRKGVTDVGVVRPDRIDEPEVIRGERREEIYRTLSVWSRRLGEDLGVSKRERWQTQFRVGRDAHVDAAQCSARYVFC